MSFVTKFRVQVQEHGRKKMLDMSKQECNYCGGRGHRIHQMDEFGTYLIGENGEHMIACPILLKKELAMAKRPVELAFPPLPGSTTPMSNYTIAVAKGLDSAIQEKKQNDWLKRKAAKEEAHRAWIERYTDRMEKKHGPRWYWLVEKTTDDNDHAAYRRGEEYQYVDQTQDEKWDLMWEEIHRSQDEQYEQETKERAKKRAFMSEEEKEEEEEEYIEELESEMWTNSIIYMHA